jgi:hypothetical protein
VISIERSYAEVEFLTVHSSNGLQALFEVRLSVLDLLIIVLAKLFQGVASRKILQE